MSTETIAEVLAAHDDCVTGCNVAPTGVRDHEMQYEVTFTCGAAFPLPSDVSPRELDAAHRAAALEPVIREREKAAVIEYAMREPAKFQIEFTNQPMFEKTLREREKAAWDDGCIQGYNTQTTLNSTMENNPYDTKEEA